MIDRRGFLAGSSGAAFSALTGCMSNDRRGANPASEARALYDRAFDKVLQTIPELATSLGLDTGARAPLRSRLADLARIGRAGPYQPLVDLLPRLHAFERSVLPPQDRIWLNTYIWAGESIREATRPHYAGVANGYPVPYPVTQLTGAYQDVPRFLTSEHPIARAEDAEAYLSRLDQFATNMVHEAEKIRSASAKGVAPPAFVIDKTVAQLRLLGAHSPADSELAVHLGKSAAAAGLAGDWRARAARLIDSRLVPAISSQISALGAARSEDTSGRASDLPEGESYFEACVRFHTSTDHSARQIHEIGLVQSAELEAHLEILLRGQELTQGTVGARLAALGAREKHLYSNDEPGRKRLLEDLQAQVAGIRSRLPDFFRSVPEAAVEIGRVPPAVELGAPRAYAIRPGPDGRGGGYYINLADTRIWPDWALPTLTFHESLPGHLFQMGVARANGAVPLLHQILVLGAYDEGWGLYAEQLADEMGAYKQMPLGRIGLLQSFLHRSARLVAETGLHSRGWSRGRAVRYLVDKVGIRQSLAENEVDRYVVWPGQGCAYKVGHNEFVRLRQEARSRLGARFDIKDFHQAVLSSGPVPLTGLKELVSRWSQGRVRGAA